MYTAANVLIIIASILIILIVLVQNSKGGGLSSSFGGGSQISGVASTNKFLEKTTWTLAIVLLVLSISASLSLSRQGGYQESMTKKYQNELNINQTGNLPTPDQVKQGNE